MLTARIARAVTACALALLASCGGEPTQATYPLPALFVTTPSTITIGSTTRTVRLSGRGFVRASRARVNGADRVTTFVSDTVLTLTLSEADVGAPGSQTITVFNGAPGGGESGTVTLTIRATWPVITALTPSVVDNPMSNLDTLTITGTGFNENSSVLFSGIVVPSIPVSSTTIKVVLPDGIAAVGLQTIVVSTPGGGVSPQAELTVRNRVPTLLALLPDTAQQGQAGRTIGLLGRSFVSGMVVSVNGAPRTTTVISETSANVALTAGDFATVGTVSITAINQAPSAGASRPIALPVVPRSASVSGFQPATIAAGSGPTTLQVLGEGFVTGSVVEWNGTPLATTFVTQARIDAVVPAALTASAQAATLSVRNPAAPVSTPATLSVLPGTIGITSAVTTDLSAASIEWVPARNRLYATVTAGASAGSVVAIDPATGTATGATFSLGTHGAAMAASHDGQFLYVARAQAPTVARIDLVAGAIDINIPVGSDNTFGSMFADDLATLPGLPRTVVMTRNYTSVRPQGAGTAIYDDAVMRKGIAGSNRIETVNGSQLLGYDNESSGFGLRRLFVTAGGLTETEVRGSVIAGFGVDMALSGARLVATTGEVVDVSTLTKVGSVPMSGIVAVDASQSRIYVASGGRLEVYGLYSLTRLGEIVIPSRDTGVYGLVRFGTDGLAILMSSQLVLLRGSLIGN